MKIKLFLVLLLFLVFLVLLLFLVPSASALDAIPSWTTHCSNSTVLIKMMNLTNSTGVGVVFLKDDAAVCPYGCNQNLGICYRWLPGAMPGEYYLIMELVAIGILIFGLYRLDAPFRKVKIFDVVMPALAVMMFYLLALQGNNIIDTTTSESMDIPMFVWLDFGFALVCIIWFFLSMFKFAHREMTGNAKE